MKENQHPQESELVFSLIEVPKRSRPLSCSEKVKKNMKNGWKVPYFYQTDVFSLRKTGETENRG